MIERKRAPIFIIGVDRSGTTLLSLMLDSHSEIAIPYESHFIVKYYKERKKWENLEKTADRKKLIESILSEPYVREWDYPISLSDIDLDQCTTLAETINQVFSAYARKAQKSIWGDKTPSYVNELHILNRLFPAARFIHIIRDGRDVAMSLIRQWWGPNDFLSAIRLWAQRVDCARRMLRMLPDDRFLELRYEDLVINPERELKRIFDFLQLDYEEDILVKYTEKAKQKVGNRIRNHHKNLGEGVQTRNIFKWKSQLGDADQAIAYEVAAPLFEELGYEAGIKSHPLKLFRKFYHRLKEFYVWRIDQKLNPSKYTNPLTRNSSDSK